jgi:lipopolysaccharide/colanic/teichoic acid biosynthesis glycosyltransferase
MVRMDLDYIARSSVWLDLKLLLLTVPAVLKGAGAE